MTHNSWLILMFAIYIANILAFGVIYFFLYIRNRRHYSIAADVLNNQRIEFAARSEQELGKLTSEMDIYSLIREGLAAGQVIFAPKRGGAIARLPSGARVELDVTYVGSPDSAAEGLWVTSFNSMGEKIRTSLSRREFGETKEKLLEICFEQLERVRQRQQSLRERRATLDSDDPDVWGYIDFLYFSTVTQTTVGYGDILPNSSIVRICVVVQILVGYLILAILLNFVFGAA